MLLAGSEMASICNASNAAIRVGINTKINTSMPITLDSLMAFLPSRSTALEILSIPLVAKILVTNPRKILATIQPTKAITPPAKILGIIAKISSTMPCTGASNPFNSKVDNKAGRNMRITIQNNILPAFLLIGCMPACALNLSSQLVEASALVAISLTKVAIPHAIASNIKPPNIRGK